MKRMKRVTGRQRLFIEEYLISWNGTRSAERAGYKGSEDSLAQIASRLLKKQLVADAIHARLEEKAMSTDEVLARLADQARINIADFIFEQVEDVVDKEGELHQVHNVEINWEAIKARGHLVKSIKPTAAGIALELHDSQLALELLAKHLGLLSEHTEHRGQIDLVEMTLEQWEQRQTEQQAQAIEILETFKTEDTVREPEPPSPVSG